MTIEYKDSKRIVGLSTDIVQTLTFEDDFSSDDWTNIEGSSVGVSGGVLAYNAYTGGGSNGDGEYRDYGSVLSDTFVWRFKWNATNIIKGSNLANNEVNISISSNTSKNDIVNDAVGFLLRVDSANKQLNAGIWDNTVPASTASTNTELEVSTFSAGTYYCEVVRLSNRQFKFTLYSDSNFSTSAYTTTLTNSADLLDLRYFKVTTDHETSADSANDGSLDDFKLYNGVTSLTNKSTNVQDNSILVEKDTASRYWFSDESTSDVTWDSATMAGYTVSGNTLTANVGGWGANARSVSTFTDSTGGTINYQTGSNTDFHYLGIGKDAFGDYTNNDYALYATNSGNLQPVEFDVSTNSGANVGTYTSSDTITMSMSSSGVVTALKNGVSIYTFPTVASGTYYAHVNSYPSGASVSATVTTPATWNVPSKTPAEIGDLKVHYDATVGVTASSNSVSAWADQSGNGKTLSSVSNPTRVEAGQNGKDYLDFNSSKSMRATGLSETAPRPFTMVLVINPRNGGSQTIIRWSQNQYLALYQDPANTYNMTAPTSVSLTDSTLDGSWNAFFMDFKSDADGGTFQINLDTANAVSGDLGDNGTSGTTATLHVGINADNNNWHGNCRYAEIILFDRVLTAYEKEQLYSHLKTKWGLP